jgi:hypothetical protein
MKLSEKQTIGWADRPEIRQRIRNTLYVVCLLLIAADFVVHRHTELSLEKIPAFYAIYGFAALVGVVLLAKALRKLVGRNEDYYEQDKDDVG